MTLAINTNALASIVNRNLQSSQNVLAKSVNRLSSGKKITRSSEDAGGVAVSSNLQARLGRNFRTQQNVQNSLSFLTVQDGALAQVSKLLDRMSELKTMSLDPTKNPQDRMAYNAEFMELRDQLKAIESETYNGVYLFRSEGLVQGADSLETKTTEAGEGGVQMVRDGLFDRLSGMRLNQKAISTSVYAGTNGTDYSKLTISTPTHGLTATVILADGIVAGSVNGSEITAAVKGINDTLAEAGIKSVYASEDVSGRLVITGTETYTLSESVFGNYAGLDLASTESKITLNAGSAGDTYQLSINGNSIASGAVAFNSSLARTALNIVSAIRNDATLSTIAKATAEGSTVTLTSLSGTGLSVESIVSGTAEAPLLSTLNGVAATYDFDSLADFRAGDVVRGSRSDGTVESYQVLSNYTGNGRSFEEFADLTDTVLLKNHTNPGTRIFQSGVDPVAQVETVTLTGGGDGDGYNVSINGYTMDADVAFNTDLATTAADLANAINTDSTLGGLVTAEDAGGGVLTLTAWNVGTAFTASAIHQSNNVASSSSVTTSLNTTPTAQVDRITLTGGGGSTTQVDTITLTGGGGSTTQVDTITLTGGGGSIAQVDTISLTGGGGAVAQVDTITLTGGGGTDTFDVTIDGNSLTGGPIAFDTDLATTVSNLAAAINADVSLNGIVTATTSGADLILTADTAGTAFVASSSSTDNGGGAATTDVTTTANVAADTFDITIDGNSLTGGPIAFDTDLATTVSNLASAINADVALNGIVTASTSGADLILTADNSGTAFVASSSSTDNGGGAATTDVTTTANVPADTFDVTIDGNSLTGGPIAFDTDLATTVSNLAAAINADVALNGIVTATTSGADLILTADNSGTAFVASSSSTDNGGGAATNDVTTTANVPADTFDVTINGNSLTGGPIAFDTNLATTVSNLAAAINADVALNGIVTASTSGANLILTADTAGAAFTASSSSVDNGGGAAATDTTTVANDPGLPQIDTVTLTAGGQNDTFNVTIDGNSLAVDIDFRTDLATTAADLVSAINADATLSAIVTAADAGGGAFTLTAVDNAATFTSSTSFTDSTGATNATTTQNVSAQGTTHKAGEIVYDDSNGHYYLSRGDGTWENNTTRASDTSNIEEFKDLGFSLPNLYDYNEYNSESAYAEDDIVRYGENLYVAKTAISQAEGNPVQNSEDWVRLHVAVSGVNDLLDATSTMDEFSMRDIRDFIQLVATARAKNRALTQQLEMSGEMLKSNHSNLNDFHSRLTDVDVAAESTQMAKANIKVQSSVALMAQANSSPNIAITLLQL
jgi:flagellin-like hook-associated protein FlgL